MNNCQKFDEEIAPILVCNLGGRNVGDMADDTKLSRTHQLRSVKYPVFSVWSDYIVDGQRGW
jgi:hypothetical protein